MTPERMRDAAALYQAAADAPSEEERTAVLAGADAELRREVEARLARELASTAETTPAAALPLGEGTELGPYRIEGGLGSGGMGDVYRAVDTRLGRAVAVKIARTPFEERFAREARMIAALNHPNICTIYDVGEQAGRRFLAMELLEGQTLKRRIGGRPLPAGETLALALEISDGLEAAHGLGIIHRDVKPENIFVTRRGHAKILDFGLAKPTLAGGAAPVAAGQLTEPGVAIGTYTHMSPEQVRGEELDRRSDLFSFGVVLYEMATGRLPFTGETAGVVAEAILNATPAPAAVLNPALAPGMGEIIAKALEKDRGLRYQTAGEMHAEFLRLQRGLAAPARRAGRGWRRAALGAGIAGLAIAVALGFDAGGVRGRWFGGARGLRATDSIVLADFSNATGDAVFDGALRQGLAVELEQSPYLRLVSDDRVQATLRMMGRPAGARLPPPVAQDLCQRVSGAAAIEGAIANVGGTYLLTITAADCATGEALASSEAQARDKAHVLAALGEAGADLRHKLGESLSTVRRYGAPLQEATTPSLEALKAYSEGMEQMQRGDTALIPLFQRAVQLDPNFAMAYGVLSLLYNDLGESATAADYARKSYELRGRTSEPERYFAAARYHKEVTGNIPAAIAACRLWIGAYPRAWIPHTLLAGSIYPVVGEYEKGVAEAQAAIAADANAGVAYTLLMDDLLALSRTAEAEATYRQAQRLHLDFVGFNFELYRIAFLRGDEAAMARALAQTAGHTGVEDKMLAAAADTAAYHGELRQARKLSQQAIAAAEKGSEKEAAATYLAASAVREALFGNGAEARRRAAAALGRSGARDVRYGAALAFGLAGDAGAAEAQARILKRDYPEDTLVQFNYLPTLRGVLALGRGRAGEALAGLEAARPYELGVSRFSVLTWTALYPVYVRGEALLAAGRGGEAAGEFEEILGHPGLAWNAPIAALARLGLGRAEALAAKAAAGAAGGAAEARARQAYQQFFALWRNADAGVPVLRQARAEYAKLGGGPRVVKSQGIGRLRARPADVSPLRQARSSVG